MPLMFVMTDRILGPQEMIFGLLEGSCHNLHSSFWVSVVGLAGFEPAISWVLGNDTAPKPRGQSRLLDGKPSRPG
jgi:hypothetical protein